MTLWINFTITIGIGFGVKAIFQYKTHNDKQFVMYKTLEKLAQVSVTY